MPDKDYYDTLGVGRDAPADAIKRAYRKLAREYHPDLKPGDKAAEQKFKELQRAYDVLSDPDSRKKYDRFGKVAFESTAGGGGTDSWNFQWSGAPGSFDFDLNDILAGLGTGAGRRGRRGREKPNRTAGIDTATEVAIPFLTAVCGGTHDVSPQIRVTIPPGIHDGARIRLRGQGQRGPDGTPGDLFVVVHVQPHAYFRREGANILLDLPLTFEEAIAGTKVDVPTVDGVVTLTVQPGTSSGQRLRIRGRGVRSTTGEPGDQLVEVRIVVPKLIDAESRELLRRLSERNPLRPRETLGWPKT